jgi:hypothetical protein
MSRRLRVGLALLLPIGPAAVGLLRFVLPYDTVDDSATAVAKIADHQDRMSLVLWLGLVAALTLVPAALCVGRLTHRGAPRLTTAALVLLVPSYLALNVMVGGDLLLWVGVHEGLDAATVAGMYESVHPSLDVATGIFVAGHVIGTVLLGVAMWRSRVVGRWAAGLTVVSQPLHFVAAIIVVSHALDLVAWGMQAVAFGAAGLAVGQRQSQSAATAPSDRRRYPGPRSKNGLSSDLPEASSARSDRVASASTSTSPAPSPPANTTP